MSLMRRNAHFEKIPNLSLLFGYAFILLIMVMFGYLQYSSSINLRNIEEQVRFLTLKVANRKSEANFLELTSEYQELLETEIFFNLQQTFQNPTKYISASEIKDFSQLIYSLEIIGTILDQYDSDLSRSQIILLMTFTGLSVILSILITVSEFDQIKKLETEKSQRILDQKLMDVLEKERNMIAIELHDDVAQKLSVLGQHFHSPVDAEHTELLKRYNGDVIQKIRTMAQRLRSPDMKRMTFREQLEFLFSDFKSISDIELTAKFNGLSALELDDEKKLHVYRIIQE
jgi:signal transduction histidine kinase